MHQSDYTIKKEASTTLIVKDTKEKVEDPDSMPIITYKKKGILLDFEASSTGTTEYVFFHLLFIAFIEIHITHIIYHYYKFYLFPILKIVLPLIHTYHFHMLII